MLPKIQTPTFETTLPLSNKKVVYRPFLAKEEKILLMALESNNEDNIRRSIIQIINNCILTDDISIEDLSSVDIEHMFFLLRKCSVGEVIELLLNPNKPCDVETCPKVVKANYNINDIKFKKDDNHSTKIQLTDEIGVIMKYPKMTMLTKNVDSKIDTTFKVLLECIEKVYDADNVYDMKDVSEKEKIEWIENLDQNQLKKIFNFFETMPYHQIDVTAQCEHCGKQFDYNLKGLSDFFI